MTVPLRQVIHSVSELRADDPGPDGLDWCREGGVDGGGGSKGRPSCWCSDSMRLRWGCAGGLSCTGGDGCLHEGEGVRCVNNQDECWLEAELYCGADMLWAL